MRNWVVLAAAAALLSGCVLPPAVSIATLAVDVGSYFVTGKTVADHGISLVMDSDCAVIRVFEDGEICYEAQEYETQVAILEPLPEPDTMVADPMSVPAQLGYLEERAAGIVASYEFQHLASFSAIEADSESGAWTAGAAAAPAPGHGLWNLPYVADGMVPAPPLSHLAASPFLPEDEILTAPDRRMPDLG